MQRVFNNKGITLIEIIVSLAILSMIVAPLSSMFVEAVKSFEMSQDQSKVNNDAQKLLEQEIAGVETNSPNVTTSSAYRIDEVDPEYHGELVLDVDSDAALVDGKEYDIDINDAQITITADGSYDAINFSKEAGDPIKFIVECHGTREPQISVSLNVSNKSIEDAYIYICKVEKEDVISNLMVSINEEQGNIRERHVNSLKEDEGTGEKSLLKQVDVKINNEKGKELINITTLKKE